MSISRPGISPELLAEAGVREVSAVEARELVGFAAEGVAIPYRTVSGEPVKVDGRPFHRLRLRTPTASAKYLSPAGSGCQAYFPPRLRALLVPGCVLGIVEGEFKALSLVEAGFPCVGVGGISSVCPRNGSGEPELLQELARVIDEVRPSRLAFVGDSDTALIPDFAREAVKLARLAGVPVVLPRIQLDSPGKGPDDLREVWGAEFALRWQRILDGAVAVGSATAEALAVRLLEREAEAFRNLGPDAKATASNRLVKLGAALREDALAFEAVVAFAASHAGIAKQTFRSATKEEHKRQSSAGSAERLREAEERFAEDVKSSPLFFDGRDYWRKEADSNFGRLCREDMRLHLGVLGFRLSSLDGAPSPADCALHRLQVERRVIFAGPICGRPPGLLSENGMQILVTRGPKFIAPKAGDCPTITALIANLLGRAAGDPLQPTQAAVFVAWLKLARLAALNPHEHRPGQVLALVGPKDCGKSLVQSAIITPALGGRVADPALFFVGGTTFNSDLWAAEHLAIGDKGLGEDGRERARLRDELKRVTASTDYPLHPKNRDAVTLRPVWRVTLSANDDPESASSLPALDASFSDKIHYLQCYAPPAPFFDENRPGARADFAAKLAAELPAFLAAVDGFEIPADLSKARFGVREFHHPRILDLIESSSPLVPVAEVLESWIASWDLTTRSAKHPSVELYGILDERLDKRLRLISSGPKHLGHQLSRLAAAEGWRGRIVRDERRIGDREQNQKQTVWEIRREADAA